MSLLGSKIDFPHFEVNYGDLGRSQQNLGFDKVKDYTFVVSF